MYDRVVDLVEDIKASLLTPVLTLVPYAIMPLCPYALMPFGPLVKYDDSLFDDSLFDDSLFDIQYNNQKKLMPKLLML